MHIIGLARIGADAVVRFLPDGRAVCNIALACNYGKKDDQGKRPTQWIDAAIFGERAQKLAPYLLKGTQVDVHLSEPHIEAYTARDGSVGSKLVAFVNFLEFAASPTKQAEPAKEETREQKQNRQRPPPAPDRGDSGFDDLEVPF